MDIGKIAKDSVTAIPCGICHWFGKKVLCAEDLPGELTQNVAQGVASLALGLIHPALLIVSAIIILVKIKNVVLMAVELTQGK